MQKQAKAAEFYRWEENGDARYPLEQLFHVCREESICQETNWVGNTWAPLLMLWIQIVTHESVPERVVGGLCLRFMFKPL